MKKILREIHCGKINKSGLLRFVDIAVWPFVVGMVVVATRHWPAMQTHVWRRRFSRPRFRHLSYKLEYTTIGFGSTSAVQNYEFGLARQITR